MVVVFSRNQVPVRLTEERWAHIRVRHPEMASRRVRVLETVESPDCVQEGDLGVRARLLQRLKTADEGAAD